MTSAHPIDPESFLADQLAAASPDLLRSMLSTFVQALMGAEADSICGAGYGERSDERVNSRNGYRHRDFDTRAGTMDLAIPKLRSGSYFPDWLLERRKRAERALTSVVATCYLLGVSTRRMEKLVQSLGVTSLSKSQVSVMAKDLDEQVEAFRSRPLDQGPYTFVAADALVLKVREGGRVVRVHALLATGVNADGHREILGLDVTSAEDGAGWLGVLPWPGGAWPVRGQTGHQRRAQRSRGGDRGEFAGRGVAALQNALRGQFDGCDTEEQLAMGESHAALDLRPDRFPSCCCAVRPGHRDAWGETPRGR